MTLLFSDCDFTRYSKTKTKNLIGQNSFGNTDQKYLFEEY